MESSPRREQHEKEASHSHAALPGDDETEFASEASPAYVTVEKESHANAFRGVEKERQADSSGTAGWFSLMLAIFSLFIWPAILGPSAVLFGFISYVQGSRALGIWSIVLGAISFLAYMVLVPMYG